MFSRVDIDKILSNKRLVHALLGLSKEEFLTLLPTFTQVVREAA